MTSNKHRSRPTRAGLGLAFSLAFVPHVYATGIDASQRERLLESQSRLAAVLIERLALDAPSGQVAVSPASAAGMLAALDTGDDPTFRLGMVKTLQIDPGLTAADDEGALRDTMAKASDDAELLSATRMIFSPLAPPTTAAAQHLSVAGVGVAVEDLSRSETIDEINAWVRSATHNKIGVILNGPSRDLRLVALNALYFKGEWESPFKRNKTKAAGFHPADGQRIRTDFMHGLSNTYRIREDERFIAIDLPFKDHRFSMVILTTKAQAADSPAFSRHLDWLSGRGFRPSGLAIAVNMPRFKIISRTGLLPALTALGLDPALHLSAAQQHLSAVSQTVDVALDEDGAQVAAVTAGFALQSGSRLDVPQVTIDKPFAFAIRQERTGLLIAAGFVPTVGGTQLEGDVPPLSAESNEVMNQSEKDQIARLRAAPGRLRIIKDF